MKSPMKRRTALLLLTVLCCAPLMTVISGCADNSKPSAKDGYYTGPMEGKDKKPEAEKKTGTVE